MSIILICQHFQYIIRLSGESIIFEPPPPNDPLLREGQFPISQSFWICIYVLTQKNCWFHLGSIALDPFGKLQKIRPTGKSDTLFFTPMNIETFV